MNYKGKYSITKLGKKINFNLLFLITFIVFMTPLTLVNAEKRLSRVGKFADKKKEIPLTLNDSEEIPKNIITTGILNPIPWAFTIALGRNDGISLIEYERAISDNSAIAIKDISIGYNSILGDWKYQGSGFGCSYRYFSNNKTKYKGIGINIIKVSAERNMISNSKTEKGDFLVYEPKIEIGFSCIRRKGFVITTGCEIGYFIGNTKLNNEEVPIGLYKIAFRYVMNLGYGW